jgi:hypothetical protein
MTPKVRVRFRWTIGPEKGNVRPPSGPTYSTVINLEGRTPGWPNEAWSAVVESIEGADPDGNMNANMRFLVQHAPHHLLTTGAKFELLAGAEVVARGVIVDD